MFQLNAFRRTRLNRRNRSSRKASQSRAGRQLRLENLEARLNFNGTWTALSNVMPTANNQVQIGTMELLSDGSVMVEDYNGKAWEKLTPSATGSYANGTWSTLANMSTERLFTETSLVLPDGRFLFVGGKFSGAAYEQNYTNTGEIYDPVANTWSSIAVFPESTFGNGPGVLLADGTVLAGSKTGPNTYIYHPTTNTWTAGPAKPDGDASWGESWTKLADGSILSVDSWNNAGHVQRLDQSTMTWSDAGTLPAAMQGPGATLGPDMMLPDGRIFVTYGGYESLGKTALYDPATNTWSDGPTVPGGFYGKNSAAAMLTNGHVLFAEGNAPSGPVHLFEYDPTAPVESSLTDVSPSVTLAASVGPGFTSFLALPSGQVLAVLPGAAHGQLYVYTPDGSPSAAWQPTISSVTANGANVYTLTGTQLNGLSVGASFNYGAEMDSNYPIVELKDAGGSVYFARTFNWSSTGVATGNTPVSTQFSLPAGLPLATYQLTVIANGIASAPVSFTGGTPVKFFVANDATSDVTFRYAANGQTLGSSTASAANAAPRGIASTAAGDKTWVVDNNRTVYVYSNTGALLGSWSAGTLANNATPEGIATNGTDVWIVDSKSDKVFKYAGAATRLSGSQNAASSFNLNGSNGDATDIVTDGASLWVVNDAAADKVFKYTVAGALQGSWTIAAANSKPTGITINPASVSDIWIVDSGTDRVYQYAAAAGRTSGSQAAAASFALAAGNTNPQGIADPPSPTANVVQLAKFPVGVSLVGPLNVSHRGNGPRNVAASVRQIKAFTAVDQIFENYTPSRATRASVDSPNTTIMGDEHEDRCSGVRMGEEEISDLAAQAAFVASL